MAEVTTARQPSSSMKNCPQKAVCRTDYRGKQEKEEIAYYPHLPGAPKPAESQHFW